MPATPAQRTDRVKEVAAQVGFDLCGIVPAVAPDTLGHLEQWRDAGHAGEMRYMENRSDAYAHPDAVLGGVRSVVMVAMVYRTTEAMSDPSPGEARVACYAWGPGDYHDVLRDRLRRLGDELHQLAPGCRTRAVVDTAPLLERDFARRAGLGWFGKNTMLISKYKGSWFFLGALLTDAELETDAPHETAHCGTCTRCLDACPTDAFVEPYVLDARKCISYLTIELRSRPIPEDLRAGVGDWLFGCDVCQDVCPWNRKSPISREPAFQPQHALNPADCAALIDLTEAQFRERFGKTPLSRAGRSGIARNACIVLGNTGDRSSAAALQRALRDDDPVVRDAAAWGLRRLAGRGVLESSARVDHNPVE